MTDYESIIIINTKLGEETRNAVIERIKLLIEEQASLDEIDEWGVKRLAYEVKKMKEGYYVLFNFKADSEFPKELERNYRIIDPIIKYLIVKKDA